MIPLKTIEDLISNHSLLEKELSSSEIDKKLFAEKSKEYSDLNEIIEDAKKYFSFENPSESNLIKEWFLFEKSSESDLIENFKVIGKKNLKGIKLSTIRKFVGLESPVIILIDLDDLHNESLLYTGITRANFRLYIMHRKIN